MVTPRRCLDQQAPACSVPVQLYPIINPSQVRRHARLGGLTHEEETAA